MSVSLPIPVACAVIERNGRILIAQRPPHKHIGLKWEFPGGKVEADETPAAAIVREIREELALDVAVVRALPSFVHRYPNATIEMIPFVCRLAPASPEAVPSEHIAVAWVAPEELRQYDLAAADWPIVTTIWGDSAARSAATP